MDILKLGQVSIVLQVDNKCSTQLHMSVTISVRLSEELNDWLENEAKKVGLPKSRIIKQQLERSRTEKARQDFLDLAGVVELDQDMSSRRGFTA